MFNIFQNKSKNDRLPVFQKGRENLVFKIPTLFSNDEIIFDFLESCKHFNIKTPIKLTYGSVKCSWSGGRSSKMKDFDEQKVKDIIAKYYSYGISCSFAFSNYHITEDMLNDFVGNKLLEIASEYDGNFAIVSSDLLANYIREKYPKIKIEISLLKPTYEFRNFSETPDYYNDLCEKYDKVVIRPELAQDIKFLKKLKYKNKIDILLNSHCVYHCPFSVKHYERVLNLESGKEAENTIMCNSRMLQQDSLHNNNVISRFEFDKLIKMGFVNFKIAGRNSSKDYILLMIGIYIFEPTGVFLHLLNYSAVKKFL